MEQIIAWSGLAWCIIPVALVCGIFILWRSSVQDVLFANARMFVQLIAIGYVLVLVFERPSPWLSLAIIGVMVIAAAWISIRPVRHHRGFLFPALFSLLTSVLFHLAISIFLVLELSPWYEPRVVIPLAGMYFANSMNTVSLGAERYHAELHISPDEQKARTAAFQAAMIPQINSLLAVGLVALPGMMTGQILSGVSPLIAVRYQILIMTMVLGASGMAVALMLWQLSRRELKIRAGGPTG